MILVAVGAVVMMGAAFATYYAISYAVLYAVGKLLPLAGRRRRAGRRT